MSFRGFLAVSAASLIALTSFPGGAFASHSVPSPKVWWDFDNDGVVDPADRSPQLCKIGTWTANQSARLTEAIATWNATDFKPVQGSCGTNQIRVDGGGSFIPGEWAHTTITATNRGSYYDISDADIWVNTGNGQSWYWLADPQPLQAQLMLSGKGILTHELGHVIHLVDLYGSNCPPGPTMCGAVNPYQSQSYKTLDSDDVSAANAVY